MGLSRISPGGTEKSQEKSYTKNIQNLWIPPSLRSNGYLRVKRPGREADNLQVAQRLRMHEATLPLPSNSSFRGG
jgi:hypothetical protein